MSIRLYLENETKFKHNKYILSEIEGTIEEDINGEYEVNFNYPIDDIKGFSNKIVKGSKISVNSFDERGDQLFSIRSINPDLDKGVIIGYAQAVSLAEMEKNAVLDTYVQNKDRKSAISQIINAAYKKSKLLSGNIDTNTNKNNLRIVRKTLREALIGDDDNTVLSRYGGEFYPDNFEVNIVDSRGSYKGVRATFAKNISGANLKVDDFDLVTEIIPVGKDALMLPEKSVKASNYDENNPYVRFVEFNDIGVVEPEIDENGNVTNEDDVCAKEQAIVKLRQAAVDKFNKEHVNELNMNLKLNFEELNDNVVKYGNDFLQIKQERVSLGDYILVDVVPFNIKQKMRVISLKRDIATGKMISCELGSKKRESLTSVVSGINSNIENAKDEMNNNIDEAKKNIEVKMEASDNKIELSVKNLEKNTGASLDILESAIEERVTEGDFEAYRKTTAKEISQKVSSGKDFSTELKQNTEAFQFLFKGASDGKTEITSDGITVYKGGFKIKNKSGDTVLWMDDNGRLRCSVLGVDDVRIYNTERGDEFYNTLENMEAYFKKVTTGNLFVDNKHIYDYIVMVLKDKGLV